MTQDQADLRWWMRDHAREYARYRDLLAYARRHHLPQRVLTFLVNRINNHAAAWRLLRWSLRNG